MRYGGKISCNMSLPVPRARIALHVHVIFQGSIQMHACICSVDEHVFILFYIQRKVVTKHRYLTCPCRDIVIQWEQGSVMYGSVT